ncbi:nuclear transport factor 2 family protein [Actinoplanes friuliensis]|uniref:SnoaL-like domain-containing protein n=1 Tax=Actinoplanes friuliensis DSM 7358 TaxID=1246995 RepID=U5W0V1_9ACTN|nr:nuclear transport factor 2 family protein [Actinoplanes friuliensis]AGZ42888.1 hypothetical protein AFR_23090 [Actinoplanes friuliensis DSM 7358]
MTGTADLVRRMYAAYNNQNAEELLTLLTDDVDWPDGPARLRGKDALRNYWQRQWISTRTHDEPGDPVDLGDGRIAVRINQTVRRPDGSPVSTGRFLHVFEIRDGLAARLDIKT